MRTSPLRSVLPNLSLAALLVCVLFLCAATTLPGASLSAAEGRLSPGSLLAAGTATPTLTRIPTATPTITLTPTNTRTPYVPRPTFTPSLTPGPGNYVVQPGDYLFKIARLLDTTVSGLRSINHLSSDEIYVGQVLAIPSPLPTKAQTAVPTLMAGGQYYVVQSGDQLLPIARRFGVTVPALKTANNLSSDAIVEGQVLVIPPPAPTRTPYPPDRAYVVVAGDQLGVIANRYGVTVTQLKAANGLTSNTIFVGQILYIPLPGQVVATQAPAPTAVPAGAVVYTVNQGDRLSIIALWYGVTMASIKSTNKLSSDSVYIGQNLVILNPPLRPLRYIVHWGDNLEKLAVRFGTTADTIRTANKMKPDQSTIFAGLPLIIPTAYY